MNPSPTDGISGGFFSLLVKSVVARHCAVSSLWLHCLSIGTDQDTSHHTQGAVAWNRVENLSTNKWKTGCIFLKPFIYIFTNLPANMSSPTLCHRVRLYISVVVLAGPNKASVRLHGLGHHVIYKTVLIPDTFGLKLSTVFPGRHRRAENTHT